MIMTVYLWHLTVMVVVVSLAYLAGGVGLSLIPGSSQWWWSRPLWLGVLAAALIPLALFLSPLERRPRSPGASSASAARQVAGAVLLCLGIALLALFGFGDAPLPMLDIFAFLMVMSGAGVSGLLPNQPRRPGARKDI
jgi:cyanate permease